MKHNIFPVFSTPIFASKLNFDPNIVNELNKEEQIKINLEEYAGSTSTDKFILNKEKYIDLKKSIMNTLTFYNETYLKYETKFQMTTSWIAKTFPKTSSALHNHTNSFLSGVLYLTVPDNSGDIMFENMNVHNVQINTSEETLYNSNRFFFNPAPGVIIFFPSNTYHKVLENNSNSERLSLAFNFMPLGNTGSEDSQFNYK
tara:strand:- start:4812 stop:5414 length:603 start_codon:yes stop_codon:yes gene_type:complete